MSSKGSSVLLARNADLNGSPMPCYQTCLHRSASAAGNTGSRSASYTVDLRIDLLSFRYGQGKPWPFCQARQQHHCFRLSQARVHSRHGRMSTAKLQRAGERRCVQVLVVQGAEHLLRVRMSTALHAAVQNASQRRMRSRDAGCEAFNSLSSL